MSRSKPIRRLSLALSLALAMTAILATFTARDAKASIAVDPSFFVSNVFTGSRVTVGTTGTGNGLYWFTANGEWSGGAFSIGWNITDNGSDFTYKYTVTTPDNAKLSHWILELSQSDANGNPLESDWEKIFVSKTTGNYTDVGIGNIPAGEVGLTGSGSGNPGLLDVDDGDGGTDADKDDIFGVRFTRDSDLLVTSVTFTTPQIPVWGDFYARDGKNPVVHAYNLGFGTDPAADAIDFTNWIPRPDGESGSVGGGLPGVPEPLSIAVWGLLIGTVGLIVGRHGRPA